MKCLLLQRWQGGKLTWEWTSGVTAWRPGASNRPAPDRNCDLKNLNSLLTFIVLAQQFKFFRAQKIKIFHSKYSFCCLLDSADQGVHTNRLPQWRHVGTLYQMQASGKALRPSASLPGTEPQYPRNGFGTLEISDKRKNSASAGSPSTITRLPNQ